MLMENFLIGFLRKWDVVLNAVQPFINATLNLEYIKSISGDEMSSKTNRSKNECEGNLREGFVDLRKLDAIILLVAEPLFIDHFLENRVSIKALISIRRSHLTVKTEHI